MWLRDPWLAARGAAAWREGGNRSPHPMGHWLQQQERPGVLAAERTAGRKGAAPEERMEGGTDKGQRRGRQSRGGGSGTVLVGFKGDGVTVRRGTCVLRGW